MKRIFLFLTIGFFYCHAFGQGVEKIGETSASSISKIGSVPVNTTSTIGNVIAPGSYNSCKEIKDNNPGATDGLYTIDPDGEGGADPFECYCDMTTDGGGWTLVTVHSDDGEANWTYNNRELYYNETFIGSINHLHRDYKGEAMVRLTFHDVLTVHAPSGVWAAYHGVGNGTLSLGQHITSIPFPNCPTSPGAPMSAGTLVQSGSSLCNTDLYFNVGDRDGQNLSYCTNLSNTYNNATYGPAWSVSNNSGCPFDDPGTHSSLGVDYQAKDTERSPVGFGWAIGGNTGTTGTGANHMKIFVR